MQAMERRGLSRNRVSRLPSKGDMLTMSESPVSSHLALSAAARVAEKPGSSEKQKAAFEGNLQDLKSISKGFEPAIRIELTTFALRMRCSTD